MSESSIVETVREYVQREADRIVAETQDVLDELRAGRSDAVHLHRVAASFRNLAQFATRHGASRAAEQSREVMIDAAAAAGRQMTAENSQVRRWATVLVSVARDLRRRISGG